VLDVRSAILCLVTTAPALGAACTLVEVDAEIRAVCSTRHDLVVEAAPADLRVAGSFDLAVEVDLAPELDRLDWLDLDHDLHLSHVRLRPTSGLDDLAFVESARVTVASADPAATLPAATMIHCAGDCPRDGADLLLPSDLEVDALDYAAAGPIRIATTLAGELPAVAWSLDIEVCARGQATASAGL
jgi:hypothetical protein